MKEFYLEHKRTMLGAGLFVLVGLSFLGGQAIGAGGTYTLDVYDGDVRYTFPLEYAESVPRIACFAPYHKVVIALSVKGRYSGEKLIRGTDYCGDAQFHAGALKPRQLEG